MEAPKERIPGREYLFRLEDQHAFARWSGDCNPIHVDPIMARRTQPGACVVHGIHQVLLALQTWFAGSPRHPDRRMPSQLTANFYLPLLLQQKVHVVVTSADDTSVVLEIRQGHASCTKVMYRFEPGTGRDFSPVTTLPPAASEAVDLDFAAIANQTGLCELILPESVSETFPDVVRELGPGITAILLGLSRIVGMHCPGLHSLFAFFSLTFDACPIHGPLIWKVTGKDARFSMVHLAVAAPGVQGRIRAFVRPTSARLPAIAELPDAVDPNGYAGQQVLVVGGSRGLGEITAKLVARSGGAVVLTCHQGQNDAQRVVDDLRAWGAKAHWLSWDVRTSDDLSRPLRNIGFCPTHVFYFATPKIFNKQGNKEFHPEMLALFCDYYVNGFLRLLQALGTNVQKPLRCFYPSTTALDTPVEELAEYAVAKAAGETLCRHVSSFMPDIKCFCSRIPRTETDQTTSMVKIPALSPLTVMQPLVEQFRHY
ncbi:MAG: SDR family NAD(P)-dependent oxidoreductase [Magnetococcales bacterium]|nr:SDR family NAD(P)-dependent oxidoreductase [Magnetococcales bacterium]